MHLFRLLRLPSPLNLHRWHPRLPHERLVWVTATGKSVSRSSVLQYRERAFTQQGAPLKQGVQVLDSSSVLVMAAVATARGRVSRSSIWHYDAERGLWRLRFRQETPAV